MRLLLLTIAIAFASCSQDPAPDRIAAANEPAITKVTFESINEAGGQHPKFTVQLVSDATVSKVILYMVPRTARWEVKNPITGTYIMYDHIGEFPTFSEGRFYYFSFIKTDGTVLDTKPFQVY